MSVEHPAPPEGHVWACTWPIEAPPPAEVRHAYRRGCEGCYVAFRAAAERPRATFYLGKNPTLRSLHPGHTEDEIRAWFIECIVPERLRT